VEVDLARYIGEIRAEWEALRDHDGISHALVLVYYHNRLFVGIICAVVFLVCIEKPTAEAGAVLSEYERLLS
jgi:hypothetical protein